MFLKRAIRIIFDRAPDETIDLFAVFPGLRRFFERRRLHRFLRTFGDLAFAFIIFVGLFGPQDPGENCIIYLSWGVWWPTIVLTWFFVGRMWCGFCPFPGIGRLAQGLGFCLNLKVPRFLRKNSPYLSVILLCIILWIEESTGIKESPRGTALLILAILSGATLTSLLFPMQAWCRYLCPMGRLIGVGSTLSMLEFRADFEKCKKCRTFACKRGTQERRGCPVFLGAFNVRNNLDCLICGHCLSLCDKDSPMLNLRSPFKELVLNKGRFITCSYIIPFLMGSQLVRFYEDSPFFFVHVGRLNGLDDMLVCSAMLAAGFFYVFVIIRLGALFFGITEDELFGKFSPMVPILVPMAFAGELAYRLDYALRYAPGFFPTIGRQFSVDSLLGLTFSVPPMTFPIMNIFILLSSVAACIYVLYRLAFQEFEGIVPMRRVVLVAALVLITGLSYMCLMIPVA